MRNIGPAILVSILLHAGLLMLAMIVWQTSDHPMPTTSVPVTMVTEVPSHEMAEAPVDELAVKTPQPIAAPPEPVVPEKKVEPVPAPVKPVPEPIKPAKKPDPKVTKTPPDKNGVKKPEPPKEALDLSKLSQQAAAKPKLTPLQQAQANNRVTKGASTTGGAPNETGPEATLARAQLASRVNSLWNKNCEGGGDKVILKIRVWPSHGGRILRAPKWLNESADPLWQTAYGRASYAIAEVDISDLTFAESDYTRGIPLEFNAKTACNKG